MAEPAKIPPLVDLKEADADRKEMYGKAGKTFMEERRKAAEAREDGGVFVPQDEPSLPQLESPPEKPETPVDDADKRAFVRAILGNKAFEKTYPLFGGEVEVLFVDRTSDEMDKIFASLEALEDEKWNKEADILCLCSALREIKQKTGRNAFAPGADLAERKKELTKLPRPLYEALLDTSRDFEALINRMIERSRDSDFWQAGGSALPLKRTAGALLTSPKPVARTGV